MSKKIYGVVAGLAAAALLVSACGGSSTSTESSAAAAASSAAPAASEAAPAATAKIGVILPDAASSARWETADRKFLGDAFTAAGVEFDIQNANGDKAKFATIADQMLASGVTALLIVNLDSPSAAAVVAKAAAQGYAEAQCNLGVLYNNGSGVAQDFKAAAAWYAKAAASGSANAPARRDVCLARVAAAAASRP